MSFMWYHYKKIMLLIMLTFSVGINLCAQNSVRNSEDAYDVTIVSKGQGSILCNEQYIVDYDDRKDFTLKNNADIKLSFSAKEGHTLSRFTINGINRIQDINNNRITIKGISRKTIIVATFINEIEDSVKLTIVSGSGGKLFCNGKPIDDSKNIIRVKNGSKISLRCNPQEGFELNKLSVNGILRDISDNTYSFEIRRNTTVNVSFSESSPVARTKDNNAEEKPRFIIGVSGPGRATLSGALSGVIAGDPKAPLIPNKEEFYVTNGSGVTIQLNPVHNIRRFVIGLDDLTQTVKSSNGTYTVGVTHQFPKFGTTLATVEFTQRYKAEILVSGSGNYTTSHFFQKIGNNSYIIDEKKEGQIQLTANLHNHLEKLIVNDTDMTNKISMSNTITTDGGPTYVFNMGTIEKNYKIVATFAADPKLTIACGYNGRADRALSIGDPTGYYYYLDPKYDIKSGNSASFFEPSAAKGSNFAGKEWILRTYANIGYELERLVINGYDMTSRVSRIPPYNERNNQEICYISLGFIKKDTKVEISYKKIQQVQQVQQVDWVDLGTGVKWATRNVGANKPTDFGSYLSWNEANALKVQKGRLPTEEEIIRLMKECHPEVVKENDVEGVRFYHRSDRSIYIFIPAAGYYTESDPNKLFSKSTGAAIWTSTDATNSFVGFFNISKVALLCDLVSKKIRTEDVVKGERMSVRLVLDK